MRESESHSVVCDSLRPHGRYSPWNFSDQNTGVGSFSLLQGIFLTHGSNQGLPYCRRFLYQLSHKGREITERWCFSTSQSKNFCAYSDEYTCVCVVKIRWRHVNIEPLHIVTSYGGRDLVSLTSISLLKDIDMHIKILPTEW